MLDTFFRLSENKTTVRTEVMAGLTTFLTMSYIIVVQPAVLSGNMFGKPTGMDFGAVMVATCLSAALATAIMGLYARYPIAQAPGMGENFFFVFSAIPAAAAAGFANPWQVALGAVFISGVLFLLLSVFGVREMIFNSISPSLKNGIAAGIGLFIAFIGLQHAGLIIKDPGTAVKLNAHFASPDLLIFFAGLLATAVLYARRVRGSILYGIVLAVLLAVACKLMLPHLPPAIAAAPDVAGSMLAQRFVLPTGVVAAPPSLAPDLFKTRFDTRLVAQNVSVHFRFFVHADVRRHRHPDRGVRTGRIHARQQIAARTASHDFRRRGHSRRGRAWHEHGDELHRERRRGGRRRADGFDRTGGGRIIFTGDFLRPVDRHGGQLSARHCAGPGHGRRHDDAERGEN